MTTLVSKLTPWMAAASLSIATVAAAQRPAVEVHGDDITLRGCVGRVQAGSVGSAPMLVWTRGDIMMTNATAIGAAQSVDRVFYWLDDDEDLAKHVGQMVEVKGDLGDFKKGEVEIDRKGDFTEIELKIGDKKEKARVPTAWLGVPRAEGEFDIVARKIDVDKVQVLGACTAR
jgi:hypothetical protein